MQNYRNAVINDTMYLIITYSIPSGLTSSPVGGKLTLMHDPNVNVLSGYLANNHSFLPNSESAVPSSNNAWHFNNLKNGEERSVLIPVKINHGVENKVDLQINLELESNEIPPSQRQYFYPISVPVALSHDPNKMSAHSDAEHICDFGGHEINYTVEFQNTGEGPTQYVQVKCQFDDKLDLNTIDHIELPYQYSNSNLQIVRKTQLEGAYNPSSDKAIYVINETDRTITFEFQDLVLAPLNPLPSMPRCVDLNSTRSSISFSVNLKPNYFFGDAVVAQSEIVFDTNAPIETNEVSTICGDPLPMGEGGGFYGPSTPTTGIRDIIKYILIGVAALVFIAFVVRMIKKKK